MCKRNDGVTSAWVILYLEEDLVAVEEIKEQPADGIEPVHENGRLSVATNHDCPL